MILSGVNLLQHPTHTGLVPANENKPVLNDEPLAREFIDDFDVRQALLIGANFVGAYDHVKPLIAQYAIGLLTCLKIQVQNRLMVFSRRAVGGTVISVVSLVILVIDMRRPTRSVHIGGIKDNAVHATIRVGKLSTVDAGRQIGGSKGIALSGDVLPEDSLAVRYVGNYASWSYIE